MESPKGSTKESKTAFKILIRSQNSSHFLQNSRKNSKLKDKTQELSISLIPNGRNNGQKTTLSYRYEGKILTFCWCPIRNTYFYHYCFGVLILTMPYLWNRCSPWWWTRSNLNGCTRRHAWPCLCSKSHSLLLLLHCRHSLLSFRGQHHLGSLLGASVGIPLLLLVSAMLT